MMLARIHQVSLKGFLGLGESKPLSWVLHRSLYIKVRDSVLYNQAVGTVQGLGLVLNGLAASREKHA